MSVFIMICAFAGAVNIGQFIATGSLVNLCFAVINGCCAYWMWRQV